MDFPVFNEQELNYKEGKRPGTPESFTTPITSRENLQRLYEGKTPLWIPFSTEWTGMHMDCDPEVIVRHRPEGGKDGWGVDWVWEESAHGAMVRPGDPKCPDITQWEKYLTVPDPDSWDWEGSYERNKDKLDPDRMMYSMASSTLFERLIAVMDFGNAAMALIDDEQKEAVHRFFRVVTDKRKRFYELARKYYHVDIMNINDDWGSQRASFFSYDTAREMLMPYMKELCDCAHELGMYVDLHCCGFVENLVPLFIEEGIDSWGGQDLNDKRMLKKQYGDKMVFSMSVDLAPDASEEELDAAVADYMETFGYDNRVICTSWNPRFAKKLYAASRRNFDKLMAEGKAIL